MTQTTIEKNVTLKTVDSLTHTIPTPLVRTIYLVASYLMGSMEKALAIVSTGLIGAIAKERLVALRSQEKTPNLKLPVPELFQNELFHLDFDCSP